MKKKIALSLFCLLVAGAAGAQTSDAPVGAYMGFDVGVGSIQKNNFAGTGSGTSVEGLARLKFGYQLTHDMALETGYFTMREASFGSAGDGRSREDKVNVSGFDVAAIHKLYRGLYVKAGLSYADVVHTGQARVGNQVVSNVSSSQSGLGYLVGAGVEFAVWRKGSVVLDYTRLQRLGGQSGKGMDRLTVGAKGYF